MSRMIVSLGAAVLVVALSPAAAAEPGNGRSQHGNHAEHAEHARPHHALPPAAKVKLKRAGPCPPGLAKKHTGCLPPGQWRKGDRLPDSWIAQYLAYAALPDFYRSRYQANPAYRYVYRDDRVFVVDAVTRTIVNIILR